MESRTDSRYHRSDAASPELEQGPDTRLLAPDELAAAGGYDLHNAPALGEEFDEAEAAVVLAGDETHQLTNRNAADWERSFQEWYDNAPDDEATYSGRWSPGKASEETSWTEVRSALPPLAWTPDQGGVTISFAGDEAVAGVAEATPARLPHRKLPRRPRPALRTEVDSLTQMDLDNIAAIEEAPEVAPYVAESPDVRYSERHEKKQLLTPEQRVYAKKLVAEGERILAEARNAMTAAQAQEQAAAPEEQWDEVDVDELEDTVALQVLPRREAPHAAPQSNAEFVHGFIRSESLIRNAYDGDRANRYKLSDEVEDYAEAGVDQEVDNELLFPEDDFDFSQPRRRSVIRRTFGRINDARKGTLERIDNWSVKKRGAAMVVGAVAVFAITGPSLHDSLFPAPATPRGRTVAEAPPAPSTTRNETITTVDANTQRYMETLNSVRRANPEASQEKIATIGQNIIRLAAMKEDAVRGGMTSQEFDENFRNYTAESPQPAA